MTKFPLRDEDIDMTRIVKCKRYKYIKLEIKFRKESTRLEYVEDDIATRKFMSIFCKLIQPYIRHAFFAKWQAEQF